MQELRMTLPQTETYILDKYRSIIGRETIRWWIKKGLKKGKVRIKLEAIKLGDCWFIDKEDLEEFLDIRNQIKKKN